MRLIRLFVCLGSLFGTLSAIAAEQTPLRPDDVAFFENRIRPVLVEQCYQCHSAKAKNLRGGLFVDSRAGLLQGGESGPAVVPGDIEESLLVSALRHDSFEMPPTGKLSAAIVKDFEKWIKMGAPDPREGDVQAKPASPSIVEGRKLWAFQQPVAAEPPPVLDESWPLAPIDRFVLKRLEDKGIAPVADADRQARLRRVYLALIGLPPTPAEIKAFLADESSDAYANVIERLLNSPQFGIRWGRHWLDVARFAESSGGGRTVIFNDAWRYRDYVIRSFNSDKPFDQFIREQIAGDLLSASDPDRRRDQLIGAGFLMLGPINYELQDKELLRMEVVDEQIDVVGRAFLGLTLGCARCHDHKFDPILATDYYALAGIFRSTKSLLPGNVSQFMTQELPIDDVTAAKQIEAIDNEIAAVELKVGEQKKLVAKIETQIDIPKTFADLSGFAIDDVNAELVGGWKNSTSIKGFFGSHYIHDANEAKGAKKAVYSFDLPAAGNYEVRISYTPAGNREKKTPIDIKHAQGNTTRFVDQTKRPKLAGSFVSLGTFEFGSGNKSAVVTISNRGTTATVIADTVQLLPLDSKPATNKTKLTITKDQQRRLEKEHADLSAKLKQLESQLAQLKKSRPKIPVAMSVRDEAETGDFNVCIRGDVHNLGPTVPRGFPVVFDQPAPVIAESESGRRELADWIASADNPLAARVMVNRVWRQLFGRGLVASTDNFGAMGSKPTHPKLLDWLAVRFMKDGWSVKSLIRQIVSTRTFGLSMQHDSTANSIDPENLLLWRMNRRRLDAETIRDSMLMVGGNLDPRFGGKTMRPGTKSSFGYQFTGTRRSVYTPVFRNTLDDVFDVFDFANPNIVTGNRTTSTLPTQALYMMNSPFVIEQASAAADQLLQSFASSREELIKHAYLQTIGRVPTAKETQVALVFFSNIKSANDQETWTRFYQAMFGSIEFRYAN